jgi:hypothetical protein
MTNDQQLAFDWIVAEANARGWNVAPMPFKLARFRSTRESLVRAGLVMKTDTGRYVPVPDKPLCPGKQQGQSERTPEGIA